jgi:predicted nucleic acid-binding Zn ribbon protein
VSVAILVQHKHCPSCGKAILPSRDTCEGACEVRWAKVRGNRKWFWRGWVAATALIVLLVVLYSPR